MNVLKTKIAGIILAAGTGSRMGRTKLLMPFKEKPILAHIIQNAKKSDLHEIIVVLGHCADKISKAVDLAGTKTVRNNKYLKGQSTSLIKGLENVSLACDAAMFLLADQPLISAAVINRLINAFETSKAKIIIPYRNGKKGNPVIIARSLFWRLNLLTSDTGARVLFDEFKESVLKVPVHDQAILIDVDTKQDYEKLISNYENTKYKKLSS